ncbi:hypothetical protein HZS_7961 [Henneguya salminicola]|nr:hypothetical protein HZS_7961 [Henneguya salminicola]
MPNLNSSFYSIYIITQGTLMDSDIQEFADTEAKIILVMCYVGKFITEKIEDIGIKHDDYNLAESITSSKIDVNSEILPETEFINKKNDSDSVIEDNNHNLLNGTDPALGDIINGSDDVLSPNSTLKNIELGEKIPSNKIDKSNNLLIELYRNSHFNTMYFRTNGLWNYFYCKTLLLKFHSGCR